jgi:mono/diheme cytochrome c family protein
LFSHVRSVLFAALLGGSFLSLTASGSSAAHYQDFLDAEFPFLEATLDCRNLAPAGTAENLVPRGVIVPLGEDVFVCFDTELLRVAAVWQGGFVTPHGMAMYSYTEPFREIPGGLRLLSKPIGKIWASTGLYPGWSVEGSLLVHDPRPRGVDPEEVGRGPLPSAIGRWLGVEDAGDAAVLRYRVQGAEVSELFGLQRNDNGLSVVRRIEVRGAVHPLQVVINDFGDAPVIAGQQLSAGAVLMREGARMVLAVPHGTDVQSFEVHYQLTDRPAPLPPVGSLLALPRKPGRRWVESATAPVVDGLPQGAYVADEIMLPYPNPWHRRIRPVDLVFRRDGTALVLTFDGDVYALSGLSGPAATPRWTRIAAGFNEPHAIQLRDDEVFVFSRLGVTRLVDHDGDGETDEYAMFSNAFTQSADTRDYPLSLVLLPDRSFLISKGGQGAQRSPHSGRVLQISADGDEVTPYASGFRNGYLSVNPGNGMITASDQQGNWVPTTPLFKVHKNSYHGFQPAAPDASTPIDPPLLWLPHRAAQSGVGQLHGFDGRAGPLKEATLLIDFHRPGLLKILLPERDDPVQAAATALPVVLPIPAIKGNINPVDGLAYFAGFRIEGSMATKTEGLCRLRAVAGNDGLPVRAEVFRQGVMLTFAERLDPIRSADVTQYFVNSWEYRRTSAYGSGQYRADGEPGVDRWTVHSVWPSADGHSVFIALADLRPTMQLEVTHRLQGEWATVYFTVNHLNDIPARDAEFARLNWPAVFAERRAKASDQKRLVEISPAQGQRVATQMGCLGCHSIDGSTEGRPGPTLRGLWGAERQLAGGRSVLADEAYILRSIAEPATDLVAGFQGKEIAMPSYRGVIANDDLKSLLLYLRTLE